jgi:excisionase family DNA binding protein
VNADNDAKGKYAGKAFLDYEEAAEYLGIKRSTLFKYIAALKIKTHKFILDRRRYIAIGDVTRIEEIKKTPWLAEGDVDLDDAVLPGCVSRKVA